MDTGALNDTVDAIHRAATRKAMLRLIPLMCAIYFMSFLDRTNVALAKVQLAADVGISAPHTGSARASSSSAMRCSKCRAISRRIAWGRAAGSRASR